MTVTVLRTSRQTAVEEPSTHKKDVELVSKKIKNMGQVTHFLILDQIVYIFLNCISGKK
jgi:hypothetical protein